MAGAESEFAAGRYNNSANRAYYACFQAAIAALRRIGIGPSSHDGQWRHNAVQAQFTRELVKRRKVHPSALSDTLNRGAALGATADCGIDRVGEVETGRALQRSRRFVAAVRESGGPEP